MPDDGVNKRIFRLYQEQKAVPDAKIRNLEFQNILPDNPNISTTVADRGCN